MKHPVEATLFAAGCFAIGVFYPAPMFVSELHRLAVLFETREGGRMAKQLLFFSLTIELLFKPFSNWIRRLTMTA